MKIFKYKTALTFLALILQAACATMAPPGRQSWPMASQNYGDAIGEYHVDVQYFWLPDPIDSSDDMAEESQDQSIIADFGPEATELSPGPLTNPNYPAFDWRAHIWRKSVQRWIKYYEGKGLKLFDIAEARAAALWDLMSEVAVDGSMEEPPVGLAIAESGANPAAHSRAGAAGMWQFMRATGKLYGLNIDYWMDDRLDVVQSTRESLRHLRDLYDRFGSWELAYSAYNAGPRRISRAMRFAGSRDFWTLQRRRFIPRETRNYVPKIIAIRYLLEQRGWSANGASLEVEQNRAVEVPELTDLKRVAQLLAMDADKLAKLNPAYKVGTVPPDRPAHLILPAAQAASLATALADGKGPWLSEPKVWTLDKATTPKALQNKYGIPAGTIADINQVSRTHQFNKGDQLTLPVGSMVPDSAITTRSERVYYRVRRGDTLSHIARRMRTSVWKLRSWNNIRGSRIYPGQRLVVYRPPAKASWLRDS